MADAAYYRRWRAAHPEYRARETERRRRSRQRGEDRSAEYAKRAATRPSRAKPPLPPVYPHVQRGSSVSFWDDELRIDVEQERALALLEGRDPDRAERTYRRREYRARPLPAFGET